MSSHDYVLLSITVNKTDNKLDIRKTNKKNKFLVINFLHKSEKKYY